MILSGLILLIIKMGILMVLLNIMIPGSVLFILVRSWPRNLYSKMESNALLEHIKFSRKGIKNIVGDRNQAAISQQW